MTEHNTISARLIVLLKKHTYAFLSARFVGTFCSLAKQNKSYSLQLQKCWGDKQEFTC